MIDLVPFDLQRDLRRLLQIASEARAARSSDFVHPGGLQWLLRRSGQPGFEVHLIGRDPLAFVVNDSGYVIVTCAPEHASRRLEILALIEERLRSAGTSLIELSVWEDDADLRDALVARGYGWNGTYGNELVYDAPAPPAPPALPEGFRFHELQRADDDAFVELHRDAWSTKGPSPYRRELHDRVTAMPDFDRYLVPVVAAQDGRFAAYCIGWVDHRSASAEIEPLATRPGFRKLGLGHAVVAELIRRAYARGARSVMVWGVNENPQAIGLYTSSGLTTRRILREMKRPV